MDRAEVLHAQSYDISGSWKNTPGENELVIFIGNSTFSAGKVYIVYGLLATQHARCHKELAAGGEPSTRFPPRGLVETAGDPDASE